MTVVDDARASTCTQPDVLVVEDDPDLRDALCRFLEAHGFAVAVAENGAVGLTKLRAGLRPFLILLDLVMPEKNGLQFRVEQLVDPMLADIPVVIYSGDPGAHVEGTVLGGVACLSKPIDADKLLEVVKAYC